MRHQRLVTVAALGLAATLGLAGCSSSTNADSPSPAAGSPTTAPSTGASPAPSSAGVSPAVDGAGKTITIWAMDGDYTPKTLEAINAAFTTATGAKVEVQTQKWDGITTKVTTALATDTPPDVLDLGNTQVASYAADGGLLDLTAHADDFKQGQTWLGGLVDPATVDGKLYGVPGFAGARAVIYNKTMWAKAGVTTAPTTYQELTAALTKVKAANPADDFSPLYLPGQYWYAGLQFVWDAGGDIAAAGDDGWKAGFSSPQAQAGLADFKAFQNEFSSKASQTLDTDKPDMSQLLADGKTSAILANSWNIGVIQKANPKLTDADLGTFAFPGKSGKTQPVMLGGSDWGIAAKSANADLAMAWVKIATSPEIQQKWVFGNDGWIPNSIEATTEATAKVKPLQKGFFKAAINSKATPANPDWAALESDKTVHQMFAAVASGSKDPAAAAAEFDKTADDALNGSN